MSLTFYLVAHIENLPLSVNFLLQNPFESIRLSFTTEPWSLSWNGRLLARDEVALDLDWKRTKTCLFQIRQLQTLNSFLPVAVLILQIVLGGNRSGAVKFSASYCGEYRLVNYHWVSQNMKTNLLCFLFLCCLSPQVIGGEFYGWTDELKRMHYTDFKPPPGKAIAKVFAYCLRSEPETPNQSSEFEKQSADPENLDKNPEPEKQGIEPDKLSNTPELEKQRSGCFLLSENSPVQVILLLK